MDQLSNQVSIDYRFEYLKKSFPIEVVILIFQFEWDTKTFYRNLIIDNYILYTKFALGRQIKKFKLIEDTDNNNNYFYYAYISSKILKSYKNA
jgi:hypothetical protein